jgi:hypothetical protein
MGSYFFKNTDLAELSCDDDLNTLKYISNKANSICFRVVSQENSVLYSVCDFFKYLFQKFCFTKNIKKLKIQFKNIELMNNPKIISCFLSIEKYLNKYVFYRNQTERHVEFSFKLVFDDAILRVKSPKGENKNNYFSFLLINPEKRSLEDTVMFLLNLTNVEYDFLLSVYGDNYREYFFNLLKLSGI